MKLTSLIIVAFVAGGLIWLSSCGNPKKTYIMQTPSMEDYGSDWLKVQKLEQEGLTDSARKTVEQIYDKAKADDNAPQRVKALLHVYKYQTFTEENSEHKIIAALKEEIAEAKPPLQSVLQSILADIYFQFFNQNRYDLLKRTETQHQPDDFLTWDAKHLTREITRLYLASLQNNEQAKTISIESFKAIIQNVTEAKNVQPTLYDFLAHRAFTYFSNDQASITTARDQFTFNETIGFAAANTFANHPFKNTDSLSTKFFALKILQEQTAFHLEETQNLEALLDVELRRLNFVRKNSILTNKDDLYRQALTDLQTKYTDNEEVSTVSYTLAQYYSQNARKYNPLEKSTHKHQFDQSKALEICTQTIEKYPDSRGANNCLNLATNIKNKDLRFAVESANLPNQPFRARVEYQNVDTIYFKSSKLSEKAEQEFNELDKEKDRVQYLQQLKGIERWQVNLPQTNDYQQHSTEIKVPAAGVGRYVIMCSTNPDFVYQKNALAYAFTNVTQLSMIQQDNQSNKDFFVLDRKTGQPLANVNFELQAYEYNYRRGRSKIKVKTVEKGTSDENGFFNINRKQNTRGNHKITLTKGDDTFTQDQYLNPYYKNNTSQSYRTFFFTDRSIYRPGQTIYFKGIHYRKTKEDIPELATNESVLIEFLDVNGQKIKELKFTTSEYGSFQGKFVVPQGLLNGRMTITHRRRGSTSISVEEYKRPKFEVVFDPVKGSFRLNENIKVTGKAKAYAGANVDNAQVQYRVVRTAQFPYYFWSYWRPMPRSSEQEIVNGTTTTDEKGEFSIEFEAIPDQTVSPDKKPQYDYQVYADVTDINGETRSSNKIINVGSISLLANVGIPEVLERKDTTQFSVKTTNLSGEFEPADVQISIHQLVEPNRTFRKRYWTQADQTILSEKEYHAIFPHDVYQNENDPSTWKKGKKVFEKSFNTKKGSQIEPSDLKTWEQGKYIVELNTKDKFGEKVNWKHYFTIYAKEEDKTPLKTELLFHEFSQTQAEPGENILLQYGTPLKDAQMLFEIVHKNKIVERRWLPISNGKKSVEIPVKEGYRGGFTIQYYLVGQNHYVNHHKNIGVPWSNKELDIELQTFRNKLYPGQEEEWRIKIKGAKKEQVAAEMLAAMYDASLDAFQPHNWYFDIYPTYRSHQPIQADRGFGQNGSRLLSENWNNNKYSRVSQYYTYLNNYDFGLYNYRYTNAIRSPQYFGVQPRKNYARRMTKSAPPPPPPAAMELKGMAMDEAAFADGETVRTEHNSDRDHLQEKDTNQKEQTDFGDVQIRKNLQETAFFFPQLQTNEMGDIILKFTMPEALTRWKLMGFAHTKDLAYSQISEEVVTQKDLMVIPNAPRFFRENDKITFSTKITNLTKNQLDGTAILKLFDALSMKPIDADLGNKSAEKSFTTKAEQSTAVSWQLNIPSSVQAVTYQVLAKANNFSDGEESSLPVLTNSMLVTESLPLPIRSKQTKTFKLDKLATASSSPTLRHERLTLEFTPQPAWYAIQALPYLMEYPHECAEQVYSRYYANSIAGHIANSTPKIKQVFETWKQETTDSTADNAAKSRDALLSNLEKNQELKSLLLEETPWVVAAKNESERKKRLGLLFDLNKMSIEKRKAAQKLIDLQLSNGAWPWFKGMRPSRYITQHIVTGFGHLDKLGIKDVREDRQIWQMLQQALQFLDEEMHEDYKRLKRNKVDLTKQQISSTQIQYLYGRSYFNDQKIAEQHQKAFKYWRDQADKFWLSQSKYMQGMIALALHRFTNEDSATANRIMKSLKENAVQNEEMGMYFKSNSGGWYWYQAPIETQALLIEAFDEVAKDATSVDALKVWLLKQKQTQDWKTTRATAEACYALLMRGSDWLAQENTVDITVGDLVINAENIPDLKTQAGTGYFKTAWLKDAIKPEMATVTVAKKDEGVSWGALYWQYFEQLDKITFAETPLSIKKEVFREEITKSGPKLMPIDEGDKLTVGDKLKIRIEIRVDRDMEYVHMKDMRAAGFEPINVLSSYKYQDGLGYYESTKDAATNFFMDYLRKGTYVFEYPLRVSHKGNFSNGITTIQCMYAPEFTSHSEGIRVVVE